MSSSNSFPSTSSRIRPNNTPRRVERPLDNTIRFLDLEADVEVEDEDEDEDEGDEGAADFIVDDNAFDEEHYGSRFSHYELDFQRQQEEELRITPDLDGSTLNRQSAGQRSFRDPLVPPRALWTIRCKPGKELNVVLYTLNYALKHDISDLFSIHFRNKGDGLLYLDTENPSSAAQILAKCVFVRRSSGSNYSGIDMRRLDDILDSCRSLHFPPDSIQRGTWVRLSNPRFGRTDPQRVTKPTKPFDSTPFDYVPPVEKSSKPGMSMYHGDIAVILSASWDNTFEVAMVPRFDQQLAKHGIKPPHDSGFGTPLLLTDECGANFEVLEAETGIRAQHGLRVETVRRRDLVPITQPLRAHEVSRFVATGHEILYLNFPRVKEWVFEEGEVVTDWDAHFIGPIRSVAENGVEVSVESYVDGGEVDRSLDEMHFLGWAAFKIWKVGSYVRHVGGQEGFIIGRDGDVFFFWKGGEGQGDTCYAAHRNTLRAASRTSQVDALLVRRYENVTMEALRLSNMSKDTIIKTMSDLQRNHGFNAQFMTPEQMDKALEVSKTFGNPWKFWDVLVWKGNQRGFYHVLDVIVSPQTKSGLKLQVRTDIVNALGAPILVDYDHVVDAELLLPLHVVKPPPSNLRPRKGYQHPGIEGLLKQQSLLHLRRVHASPSFDRAVTPPPAEQSTSSDSWNPEAQHPSLPSIARIAAAEREANWWRSNHPSQLEFYELDSEAADLVLFQVKLDGSIPDLKSRKYTNGEKSPVQSIYFLEHAARRTLTVDWNRVKGRLPSNMVIHPQRPTKNTHLPLVVLRGELKGQVMTKIAGVGTDIYALPVAVSTGEVETSAPVTKVVGHDCCVVRLRGGAHKRWSKFKPKDWEKDQTQAAQSS